MTSSQALEGLEHMVLSIKYSFERAVQEMCAFLHFLYFLIVWLLNCNPLWNFLVHFLCARLSHFISKILLLSQKKCLCIREKLNNIWPYHKQLIQYWFHIFSNITCLEREKESIIWIFQINSAKQQNNFIDTTISFKNI